MPLGDDLIRINLATAPDSDYVVGDSITTASCTNAANDGTFAIVGVLPGVEYQVRMKQGRTYFPAALSSKLLTAKPEPEADSARTLARLIAQATPDTRCRALHLAILLHLEGAPDSVMGMVDAWGTHVATISTAVKEHIRMGYVERGEQIRESRRRGTPITLLVLTAKGHQLLRRAYRHQRDEGP